MEHSQKISAVILAKNEEKVIASCLQSVDWCDEIIVIDDGSMDKTAALAKKHKAQVISHHLNADYSQQRNFGLSQAKNEWVLFVDADEQVSEKLQKEIQEKLIHATSNGYFIPRKDFLWGKELKHGEQGNIQLVRLARKSKGKWQGRVHEVWKIQGPVASLHSPLLHFPHQSLTEFLKEINTYSTIRAKELYDKGVRSGFFSVLLYPKAKFIYNYVIRLGFLDGTQGFLAAMLMSFHSFLVRGKLWQLRDNK